MALFNFGKKKDEKEVSVYTCNDSNPVMDKKNITVKVLGLGCTSCHILFENTKEALKNKGVDIEVEYVTDMSKIMEYGVMSIPALIMNEEVISMGKVLKTSEVERLLNERMV